jgi:DNA-directed RNA polymerase specialized sigma24 family protein
MYERVKSETQKRDLLYSQILEALDIMPETLREIFVLQHYNGLTQQAIARKTGIEPIQLSSLVSEANSTFQRALKSG